MDIRAEIKGFDELQRGFTILAARLASGEYSRRAIPFMKQAMAPLAAEAMTQAPVKTGELRAGIRVHALEPKEKRATVDVEQTVRHGVHVDLGTKGGATLGRGIVKRTLRKIKRFLTGKGRANPYLQRAANATQRAVLDTVSEHASRLAEVMVMEQVSR